MFNLIIALIITGCASVTTKDSEPEYYKASTPEINKIVNQFTEVTGIKVNFPVILVTDLPEKRLGICYKYGNGLKLVKLNQDYYSDLVKYNSLVHLVVHELIHCALDKSGHSDKTEVDLGNQSGIMLPSIDRVDPIPESQVYEELDYFYN